MTFEEKLQELGVKVRRGARPGEINVCCPFCPERGESEDTRFRLGINVRTGFGHCFNCNWGSKGSAKTWLLRKLNSDSDDVEDTGAEREEEEAPVVELPEGFQLLKDPSDDWYVQTALDYLLKRGVTKQQIARNLVGTTSIGRYAYRVVFPVIYARRLRGLVARDFTGKAKARYINSVGTKFLHGLPHRKAGTRKVVLSEGILKGLAIERATGECAPALLGHSLTDVQLEQLARERVREATIWPDPIKKNDEEVDSQGLLGMAEVAGKLEDAGVKVYMIWPPPKAQADEIAREEVRKFYRRNKVRWNWSVNKQVEVAAILT